MSNFRPVAPTNPPAPYIGGKRQLARRICGLIESIDHTTYAEAFVGMGGVFFRRTKVPKSEVINDYSGDVANLFRILQRHYPQLLDTIKFQISSRREFDRLKATDPTTLTDLERAARFLYLQRLAFGGRVHSRHFGVSTGRPSNFDLTKMVPMLEDVHERLAGAVIENLPWADFLVRYDRPGTLFVSIRPTGGRKAITERRYLIGPSIPRWPGCWKRSKDASSSRSMTFPRSATFSEALISNRLN